MVVLCGVSACAQPGPYRLVENWANLPEGRAMGAVSWVAVDRKDDVWVFERCGGNDCTGSSLAPILKFDPSGKFLKSFGEGKFVFPHGIHVDKDGYVWAVDGRGKDGKGHQVFKFSPEGDVLLTLGKAGVAGDSPDTFNSPSAVVVAPNGDIFVADGHGGDTNARIMKFSKDGRFIKAWGKKGSGPGEFDTPHSLAMDSKGRLFVADRALDMDSEGRLFIGDRDSRIQIFDQDGNFLEEWRQFGRPSGIFIDAQDTIYVTDAHSDKQGVWIGSAKDGVVKAFIPALGPENEPTSHMEGVGADSKGNVYGAEARTRNLRKFVRN